MPALITQLIIIYSIHWPKQTTFVSHIGIELHGRHYAKSSYSNEKELSHRSVDNTKEGLGLRY